MTDMARLSEVYAVPPRPTYEVVLMRASDLQVDDVARLDEDWHLVGEVTGQGGMLSVWFGSGCCTFHQPFDLIEVQRRQP